jgi:hypothetical protein
VNLVEKLIAEQERLKLSDRAFAKLLGVSQALWSNTKTQKWPVGRKIMAAAVREFPTLANDVLKHLQTVA